ncbi:inositol monophosphatase family protein [Bdellovibrionota bacterium]
MEHNDLRNLAVSAAKSAAEVTEKYFGKITEVGIKPDAGLVTVADGEAEEAIIKEIHSKFPDHQIFAEESGEKKTSSPVRWIIDPLDGTTNYAHGVHIYAISIGVEVKGELAVGVIYVPKLNEMFVGVRGEGSTLNDQKIKVSETSSVKDSVLATGFSYVKSMKTIGGEIERLGNVLQKARAVRRMGSAAIDLAFVACGRYDGFWEAGLSPWDVAAGAVIVEEAGGKITKLSGEKFDPFIPELIASNGFIHEEFQKILET